MIVYKTTNLINGKIYIGQDSKNNENYYGSGILILRAIEKFGIENFSKEILEECNSKSELDESERRWIKYYNSQDKNKDGIPDLLGENLGKAIKNGNRAEAWFQIRYASNGDKGRMENGTPVKY